MVRLLIDFLQQFLRSRDALLVTVSNQPGQEIPSRQVEFAGMEKHLPVLNKKRLMIQDHLSFFNKFRHIFDGTRIILHLIKGDSVFVKNHTAFRVFINKWFQYDHSLFRLIISGQLGGLLVLDKIILKLPVLLRTLNTTKSNDRNTKGNQYVKYSVADLSCYFLHRHIDPFYANRTAQKRTPVSAYSDKVIQFATLLMISL